MELSTDQLSRIDVSGYKSIKDCSIKLNNLNILIGNNGSGKSNFISIFILLQKILSRNLQVHASQCGLDSLFFNGTKVTDEISLRFYFGLKAYGFSLIPTDDSKLIFRQEYFGHKGNCEKVSIIGEGHYESLWPNGSDNHCNDYPKPILNNNCCRVYHFHDTSNTAKLKLEQCINNNLELANDASNLAAFLYLLKHSHEKNYKIIVQTIQLIFPYFEDFILEPQASNSELIVLRWKQVGCDEALNADLLSDGTLRFICLTVLLEQPHDLQPSLIIIDEPELGLNPRAITIFSEMVKELLPEKQIIISTQSIELLNTFDVDDIIVVNRNDNGSIFKRLDRAKLEDWLDDYTLGDLWGKNILNASLVQ